jgi:hypothetical protein
LQHENAAASKDDSAAISKISAAASAGCFSVAAAVGPAFVIPFTAGAVIAGVAIGSLLVRNYFARQEAEVNSKIDLLVNRSSVLTNNSRKGTDQ